MERRKFRSLEKAEEIIIKEEEEIKKEIAKLRSQVISLQQELSEINKAKENWTNKLENATLTANELVGILDYISQLSLKVQEILHRISEMEKQEENLKEILSDKMRMKISIGSVKKRLKEKIASEEAAGEIRELDEYTRIRNWFN